jgi:hypothetical protein
VIAGPSFPKVFVVAERCAPLFNELQSALSLWLCSSTSIRRPFHKKLTKAKRTSWLIALNATAPMAGGRVREVRS